MLIQFSVKSIPTTSSATRARPIWAPKLRTRGSPAARLRETVTRYISGCDVPGRVSQCIRKSRSLNEGSSDCPSNGQTAIPATTAAPVARYTGAAPG